MEEFNICAVCGRTSREVNLIDAVLGREKEISKLCENCAIIEQAVVILKPTKMQLERTEIPYTVYERLVRMSSIKGRQEPSKKVKSESITLSLLHAAKQVNAVKKEAKKEDIAILETEQGKTAVIDFSSKKLRVGDLQKLKRKITR